MDVETSAGHYGETIDGDEAFEIGTKAGSVIGVCWVLWCLGQPAVASDRVTFTHDVRDNGRAERIVAYELPWVVAGFVEQSDAPDAVFGGALPLRISAFKGYLSIDGGGIVASSSVPRAGTHANFMARAHLRLTERVALTYWHWSNGNLGERNPSVDAIGVSVRLYQR